MFDIIVNIIINIINIVILNRIGFSVSKLNDSSVLIFSFEIINQYDGSKCAIFTTNLGRYSIGTNEPHRKLEPSAITFTIPFIASLLLVILPNRNDIDKVVNVNTNKFIIYNRPCKLNIVFPRIKKLNIT